METLTAILVVSAVFIYSCFIFSSKKIIKQPPGPKGYPFVGNTFGVNAKNIQYKLSEWGKKYGDIFQVRLFGANIIVLNSSDVVRKAFLEEPNATIFSDRVPDVLVDEFTYGRQDIGLGSYNEKWLKRRKLTHRILKSYGTGFETFENSLKEQLNSVVKAMKTMVNDCFDPGHMIDEFLWGSMSLLISGRRHNLNSKWIKAIKKYDECKHKLFQPVTTFLLHLFPFIRHVPSPVTKVYYDCKNSQKNLDEMTKREIQDNNGCKGVVHDLYTEMVGQINEKDESNIWLTEQSIFAILSNLVDGTILTSKTTMDAIIHILLSREDIQRRLQQEVDDAIEHGRQPSIADKSKMPYTEAFITETLRFVSPLPVLAPHYASRDAQLNGYDIQKGSVVLVNVWNIHHDDTSFPDPYKFEPERFLDKDGQLLSATSPQRKNFLCFGIGKRSCIGEIFARNRMFLFISTMMQNFTFLPAGDDSAMFDPHDMDLSMMLLRMTKSFKCRIKCRMDTSI